MSSFKDFLRWYNNKDVVPTLETMQKMIAFYHDKDINMLELDCTLPSTMLNFIPSQREIKTYWKKFEKTSLVAHLLFLHAKQLPMKLLSRSLQTYANLLLGLMPAKYTATRYAKPCTLVFLRVGISTQKPVDSHFDKTRPVALKKCSGLFFNVTRRDCIIESFYTTGRQKKTDRFSADGFCSQCNIVFGAMCCFYHFCPCQELRPSLTEEDIKHGSRRKELDDLRRGYIQEKGFTVIEMCKCEWWRLYKTTINVKLHIRENFPDRRSLREQQLLEGIKKGNLFGYVQCDVEVPEKLRANFANFPPIFKNNLVSKDDIDDLMKMYAEEEGIMSQPRKMLISSLTLQIGILITPLLLFYLQLGLVVTKTHHFVEYTTRKCFNSFVQAAVDARRKSDENSNSSVVAETMKLLANSSYGYQIMDRSRHTVTKYLSDEKTHTTIDSKQFKGLDHMNSSLYEVELAKAKIEHKEPVIVGFFILQYAKLRILELYYNFFTRFCDVNNFEELEMETYSPYLALAEKEPEDCIRPEMRAEWQRLRSNDGADNFTEDSVANFFLRTCCVKNKQHDKRELGLFKEEFRYTEMLCLCSKTYC